MLAKILKCAKSVSDRQMEGNRFERPMYVLIDGGTERQIDR